MATTIPLPIHLAYIHYYFDRPAVFYNIDMYVKWENQPSTNTGTYAAFQFSFQNGAVGYFGTQIDKYGKQAIFSIWDVNDNSLTALPVTGCVRFDHEGTGSSCIKPYEWIAGREYMVRIWVLNEISGGVNWGGWIKDTVTGEETLIGIITLKNTHGYAGYGWLRPEGIGFQENSGYGTVSDCHLLPYSKVSWRGPYANNSEYAANRAISNFPSTICFNNNIEPGQRPFITIETGGGATRKISSGESLWDIYNLSVSKSGNGFVTSNPHGINCGSACSANFPKGTSVMLTAIPATGSYFSHWSGNCQGASSTCAVSLDSARNVTANFSGGTSAYTQQVVTMFTGYFGRPAAASGQSYYEGLMTQSGGNYRILVDDFYKSAESQAIYGGLGVSAQVTQVFRQLFSRDPQPSGLTYWTQQVNQGVISVPEIAYTVAYNAADADSAILGAKRRAALEFSKALAANAQYASAYSQSLALGRAYLNCVNGDAAADAAIARLPTTMANMAAGVITYTCP